MKVNVLSADAPGSFISAQYKYCPDNLTKEIYKKITSIDFAYPWVYQTNLLLHNNMYTTLPET